MAVIWGKREGEYFWGRGWTGEIRLIWLRKLAGTRSARPTITMIVTPPWARPQRSAKHDLLPRPDGAVQIPPVHSHREADRSAKGRLPLGGPLLESRATSRRAPFERLSTARGVYRTHRSNPPQAPWRDLFPEWPYPKCCQKAARSPRSS